MGCVYARCANKSRTYYAYKNGNHGGPEFILYLNGIVSYEVHHMICWHTWVYRWTCIYTYILYTPCVCSVLKQHRLFLEGREWRKDSVAKLTSYVFRSTWTLWCHIQEWPRFSWTTCLYQMEALNTKLLYGLANHLKWFRYIRVPTSLVLNLLPWIVCDCLQHIILFTNSGNVDTLNEIVQGRSKENKETYLLFRKRMELSGRIVCC